MTDSSTSQSNGWSAYKRLLSYVVPYWQPFAVSMFGFVIYAGTQTAFARWMEYVITAIENGTSSDYRGFIAGLVILIFACRGLGTFLGSYCIAYVTRKVVNQIRQDLFQQLLRLPSSFYAGLTSGQLLSKLTFNVEQVTGASSKALTIIVREGLTIVGLLAYLLYLNWQLTLILLLMSPVISFIVTKVSKRFRGISKRLQSSMGDVTSAASETIHSVPVVKIYGGEETEQKTFMRACERERRQRMRLVATTAVSTPMIQLVVATALAVLVYIGLEPSIIADMNTGQFTAFIIAAGMIAKPLRQITDVNAIIQQGIAAALSLFELIDSEPEQDQGTIDQRQLSAPLKGHLQFDHVGFRFPGAEEATLDDISFTIEPGQTVALVGASGSGKSTIANLVPRFYEVGSGEIRLDGHPLTDYTLKFLRSQVAYVDQRAILFDGSIRDNIAYGELADMPDEKILAAAEQARVLEFADGLPEGLNTAIGEHGQLLSGGQRQRICIARALLKNAPVLILDEATSALDNQSEQHIQAALDSALSVHEGVKRTTLVIAHRLSTIENADLILVMEKGRIVESGDHRTLLQQGGQYARLHQSASKD